MSGKIGVQSVADYLSEVNSILNAVPIQLLVLDLDKENLDTLFEFADRWKGVKILFQASRPDLQQDFRSWMADEFICKQPDMQNIMDAAKKLLKKITLQTNEKMR